MSSSKEELNIDFKVSENEIPSQITIQLHEIDKCYLARMLTDFLIPAKDAGSNFQNIFRKGLKKVYNEYYPDDK